MRMQSSELLSNMAVGRKVPKDIAILENSLAILNLNNTLTI